MKDIDILKFSFYSPSDLWNNFSTPDGSLNTLYYPSAGEDLRPFVFSKKENLQFIGLENNTNYIEPDLFIFSDYFPYPHSRFFDNKTLFFDINTQIYIEDYCEIIPTDNYQYRFNKKYVHFEPSLATGKAIFFRARISSHKIERSYVKHGIYFFYENVNLIEQLFIKNKMPFSHLVWRRDGSGLGGGNVRLNFIFNVSFQCNTKFFFIWDHYLNQENPTLSTNDYNIDHTPPELKDHLKIEFQMSLHKKLEMRWNLYEKMNLYFQI